MALRLSLKKNGAAELRAPERRAGGYTEGLSITRERADGLISDSLAKSLVKETQIVYTTGRHHAVINLDTVSAAFLSGEVVDVNSLKERGLIKDDVAYIKVLARGSLDKALFVYANGFSSTAIKMIALSGGEAHHAVTKIKR
jgi:ribosomal protein L15